MSSGFTDGWGQGLNVKRKNGIVTIMGYIQTTAQTSWGKFITQLPDGFRPMMEIDFVCRTTISEVMKIAIGTDGSILTLNLNNGADLPANEYIWLCATFIV